MEQYIPKSALVAEIERLMTPECGYSMNKLLDNIDLLDVKEVDLEREIDLVEEKYHGFESLSRADIIEIIKHFFELGLKAQHSSIDIPNIDDIFEEEGIDPNSKDAKIFKECYYMALEKLKAQKGEGV